MKKWKKWKIDYVKNKIMKNSVSWFPLNKALSLTFSEEKSGDNTQEINLRMERKIEYIWNKFKELGNNKDDEAKEEEEEEE